MEACKLRIASGIQSEITTFRKSSLFFCFWLCSFFSKDRKSFYLALLVSIDHSHSISRHKPSRKLNMCDFVASSQAFVAKAVIACDHWCPYIVRPTNTCMETRLKCSKVFQDLYPSQNHSLQNTTIQH